MTPEPDADVAAMRRAFKTAMPFQPYTGKEIEEAKAALDRLAARLQEAERDRDRHRRDAEILERERSEAQLRLQEAERKRDEWRADYTRINTIRGKDVLALKEINATLREQRDAWEADLTSLRAREKALRDALEQTQRFAKNALDATDLDADDEPSVITAWIQGAEESARGALASDESGEARQ